MVKCMAKRTCLIPYDTATQFETTVPPTKRSKVVSKLIQAWLGEKRHEETRQAIVEGCHELSEVYRDAAAERSVAEDQTWRVL
jgi:hypothetical protein